MSQGKTGQCNVIIAVEEFVRLDLLCWGERVVGQRRASRSKGNSVTRSLKWIPVLRGDTYDPEPSTKITGVKLPFQHVREVATEYLQGSRTTAGAY